MSTVGLKIHVIRNNWCRTMSMRGGRHHSRALESVATCIPNVALKQPRRYSHELLRETPRDKLGRF